MYAKHISRSQMYRSPYGAVPVGSAVRLCIDVFDAPDAFCELRIWSNHTGEKKLPMELVSENDIAPELSLPKGATRYGATFTPDTPDILWYSFIITASDGSVWHYGAQDGRQGGEGTLRNHEGPSFQMTVYTPREVKPSWYRGGIAYQIFPDRFARGSDWEARANAAKGLHKHGLIRHVEQDWNKPVRYTKDEAGRVTQWDFYGGTLKGITEHLDYLKNLGVTVLYLNPIVESASNHRYDTGNFFEVDPFLGDDASFTELCEAARAKGISVVLDGVFNHTGCDSIYFNKYGNYDSIGAYQSEDSPYRSWFNFADDGSYSSWWGVGDLPDLNENNPAYRHAAFGPEGIVRHWLKLGAAGWRLDVADELPDDFIAQISAAARAEKNDALVLGEVWEDASNKVSYGKLREYFLGSELDCAMNYNLRRPLLDYLLGYAGSDQLTESLESMRENYPEDAFYQAFNMLGTHDTERILTVLGGAPAPHELSDEQKFAYRLNEGQLGLAKGRLWLAALLQMCLPGVPSIYYGDEAGAQGYADPYNRQTFPWDHIDQDCQTIYRNAALLRTQLPPLTQGRFAPLELGNQDIFGFSRQMGSAADKNREAVVLIVNRSLSEAHEVCVPRQAAHVQEVISGRLLEGEEPCAAMPCGLEASEACEQGECWGRVKLTLPPLGSAVLYFYDEQPGVALEPGSGVLAHVTSLPAAADDPERKTLGAPAHAFVRWLQEAHQRYWQILPLNPCDQFGSPYAGLSAFAGNPELVSAPRARARAAECEQNPEAQAAWQRAFDAFCEREAAWLEPYAAFCALKARYGADQPWQTWPQEAKLFSAALMDSLRADAKTAAHMAATRREQFEFSQQWAELHAAAAAADISIVGDMPMYVSADSADVWSHPELFDLDAAGFPRVSAGAPPDAFSAEGQVWGNPTFKWDVLAERGFDWWVSRMRRAYELYDVVRLDHFLGFAAYYTVPQGASGATGTWRRGPGMALFEAITRALGPKPLIAEDLGQVSPAARVLVARTGAYGMEVAQFSDSFTPEAWPVSTRKIAYTGTHDNETLVGYFAHHNAPDAARTLAKATLATAEKNQAPVTIVQLQDALLLDNAARMNTPGTCEGNWSWAAEPEPQALLAAAELLRSVQNSNS